MQKEEEEKEGKYENLQSPRGRYDVSSSEHCGSAPESCSSRHSYTSRRRRNSRAESEACESETGGTGSARQEPQESPLGRYDVSSSAESDSSGGGSITGRSTPPASPLTSPLGRYDVSSSSAGRTSSPRTPLPSPAFSSAGRYGVSSSSSSPSSSSSDGGSGRRSESSDCSGTPRSSTRWRSPRKSAKPGVEQYYNLFPQSYSSDSSSDGDFGAEEFNRFIGGALGGGLGLPQPRGLKFGEGGGAGLGLGFPGVGGVFPDVGLDSDGDWDSESKSESDGEIYTLPGPGRKKAGPSSPAPLVAPSVTEFAWEVVNLRSPLSPHKSLLDRLAGMGTRLPGSCPVLSFAAPFGRPRFPRRPNAFSSTRDIPTFVRRVASPLYPTHPLTPIHPRRAVVSADVVPAMRRIFSAPV